MSEVQTQLQVPVLVWIDDNNEYNQYEIQHADSIGIQVIELNSTAEAKAWVQANLEFIRENDQPSRLRFISDNVRRETNERVGDYLNVDAGQSILRFLREQSINAPVLIYTSASIDSTRYVESFGAAGSTTSAEVCLRYIENLSARKNNDVGWQEFYAW
ncbi:hypothetical protein CPB83DRAFT_893970 [Crepidotus variabilis]|uniref:Uncharacterized protein n=1 Tax=Crepidotus variabilis TaxID=179855 RepID=A0A9P6EH88_9AGAR|nr:hypothetical protein CPB83DRAFT_893970 [Crepidotus variabilis]